MFSLATLFTDERLDEIALNSLKTIPARSIVAAGTGAVASFNFGLPVGLTWLAAALLCEAWTWGVTRPHVRGHVSQPQRVHYAISLVTAVVVWTLLGLYAWHSDKPLQQAAAVAIWTSQLLCAASFAFQTPRGFALIAFPPSLAMMIAPFIAPHASAAESVTVFAMLGLCILYAVIQASQTAGFRRDLDGAHAELRASEARADASARSKTEFLANMSHELRTPLTAIIGFSELLGRSPSLDAGDARRAGLILDASTTLLTVLNDVLDVSKMEAGALDLDPRAFDMGAMVRDTLAVLQIQADDKGLWLRSEGTEAPVFVVGDPNRLRQVLLNLLTNALKFTRVGGVTVSLETGAPQGGSLPLRLAVKDTGIGVAEDKQALLFERFAQADGSISREYGGTGLGLAISKRLIEMMGGAIGVDSEAGEGAAFWFEVALPLAVSDQRPAAPEALDMPAEASSFRLLIAEDHPVNRELLTALLSPHGLDMDLVCDGAEALHAVQTKPYDLILMDIQMPVMDGMTATRRIRALHGHAASTPIIAMTANVFPEQIAQYRAAGADGHIGKPIDQRLLMETIAAFARTGG